MARPSHLDQLIALLGAREPMFTGGWGEWSRLDDLRGEGLAPFAAATDAELAVTTEVAAGKERLVRFRSPAAAHLADGAAAGQALWLPPPSGRRRAAVLVLAASREEGYGLRRAVWGALAKRHDVDVFVLENPYYGARRASGQRSASLPTVADQLRMNLATMMEGLALVQWLHREGFTRVAVTGFSMGGAMAASVGALSPSRIAVVPIAAALSPAPIFTEGVLSKSVAFAALGSDETAARRELAALLDGASLARLPPPKAQEATLVIGCAKDGFVPPSGTRALAEHWRSELRWLRGGHVSVLFLERGAMRRAVLDALARLG